MYFNVSQLMRESSGSARAYEINDFVLIKGIGARRGITGKAHLLRTDRGIWVTASLDTETLCSCSRCLENMQQPVHMEIEEEYLPEIDVFTGARLHDVSDFDENFYIDQNHHLDLTDAVNQYIDMNMPMKPVCSENCAGICMTCGMNLNEVNCICDKEARDPRWGVLMQLVSSTDNNN